MAKTQVGMIGRWKCPRLASTVESHYLAALWAWDRDLARLPVHTEVKAQPGTMGRNFPGAGEP